MQSVYRAYCFLSAVDFLQEKRVKRLYQSINFKFVDYIVASRHSTQRRYSRMYVHSKPVRCTRCARIGVLMRFFLIIARV